jgi:microcystin degradation protein MlrC
VRASAIEGLVVLSDTGDSVLGGAGGDSTVLLREMIAQGIDGPALVPIVDPVAAAELAGLQPGATVAVRVGGRVAGMHESLSISGILRFCGEATVEVGGGYSSPVVDLGATAVVETEVGTVVITEMPGVGGVHPDMYLGLGIDPSTFKLAVLKTASNFQYFAPISSAVVRADTSGPTQSDIGSLDWQRIPRPIYPLDDLEGWR